MRKVIFEERTDAILLSNVSENTPIFAKVNDKLAGMIVREGGEGWILRLGGGLGSDGYHKTREKCIKSSSELGYEFFIV